jgi:hypothetical protein
MKGKPGSQGQRLRFFLAGLGRGFVTMALDDPVFVVNALKFQVGLAQPLALHYCITP